MYDALQIDAYLETSFFGNSLLGPSSRQFVFVSYELIFLFICVYIPRSFSIWSPLYRLDDELIK